MTSDSAVALEDALRIDQAEYAGHQLCRDPSIKNQLADYCGKVGASPHYFTSSRALQWYPNLVRILEDAASQENATLELQRVTDPKHPKRAGLTADDSAFVCVYRGEPKGASDKSITLLGELTGEVVPQTPEAWNDPRHIWPLRFVDDALPPPPPPHGNTPSSHSQPEPEPEQRLQRPPVPQDGSLMLNFRAAKNRVAYFQPAAVYRDGWPHLLLLRRPGKALNPGDELLIDLPPNMTTKYKCYIAERLYSLDMQNLPPPPEPDSAEPAAAAAAASGGWVPLLGVHLGKSVIDRKFNARNDVRNSYYFQGTVSGYDSTSGLFSIEYEDGDAEEITGIEMAMLIIDNTQRNKSNKPSDPTPPPRLLPQYCEDPLKANIIEYGAIGHAPPASAADDNDGQRGGPRGRDNEDDASMRDRDRDEEDSNSDASLPPHPSLTHCDDIKLATRGKRGRGGRGGSGRAAAARVAGVRLAQLEAEIVYEVGGFLTTLERKPLSLVCRQLHQKTTDATYGSKLNAAFIETTGSKWVLEAAVEVIEASNATLTHIRVDDPKRQCHKNRDGNTKGAEPVVFEKTKQLHITHTDYLDLVMDWKWMFPSLEVLSVGKVCGERCLLDGRISHLPAVTHIVSTSRAITSIKADVIDATEGDEWQAFTRSLSGCPNIRSISGIHLEEDPNGCIYDSLGRLTTALDTNWRAQHMIDHHHSPSLLVWCRLQPPADRPRGPNHFSLQDLLTWAEKTKCKIVLMPREDDPRCKRSKILTDTPPQFDDIVIDCSKEGGDTLPAPHGPVGQLITDLTTECDAVKFVYGGAPLHDTWGPVLTFPTATKLSIHPPRDRRRGDPLPPVRQLITSIPEWLVAKDDNGNNTHLPNIQHLCISISSYTHVWRDSADNHSMPTGAEAARLQELLGSLTGVRQVFCDAESLRTVSQCVSYLHARELDELHIRLGEQELPDASHVPVPGLAFPAVKSLHVSNEGQILSKGCARSVLSLLMSIKPAKASISLRISTESLAGKCRLVESLKEYIEPCPRDALRALLREAEREVGSAYDVVESWRCVEGNGYNESYVNWMNMELVLSSEESSEEGLGCGSSDSSEEESEGLDTDGGEVTD
ncbi:unnamed protein product [Vitrella brassicaformis CCMP3155]|uniref:PTM/DIR17-like Tudor domain-containing protein n=1 Tax=Vitrella brassicaformis (strain CCMP3155) TaxID=1169540 RepID=A0A0G4EE63_VITBC|nr:unnamed protein product [Vitrella brassicaformis CCMP3155]|eukprot:CEL93653.1 unnamed protein product [Vitrella brassicaformis CCMP3155]